MKKFIVIYHAPADAQMDTSNMSPEQQAEGMEAWMTWAKKCGDKLVDLGAPLMNGKALSPDGKNSDSIHAATSAEMPFSIGDRAHIIK